jgi:hypothetical protein
MLVCLFAMDRTARTMVEEIMFFSGGFLVATLLALIFMPAIHQRAVRLTSRRFEDSLPLSLIEALARTDGLRAEFAMSTRRLERQVEQLKLTAANQLGEIGRLRAELARNVPLQKSLVERGQFLNRCDDEISAVLAKIATLQMETGRIESGRNNRQARS